MQKRSSSIFSLYRLAYLGICMCLLTLATACTSLDNKPITDKIDRPIISKLFNPYRPDIVQGNFVSKEQLDSIRPGMTKDQGINGSTKKATSFPSLKGEGQG